MMLTMLSGSELFRKSLTEFVSTDFKTPVAEFGLTKSVVAC